MDRIGSDQGYVFGYTTIILSLLLVFFGLRSYRDNVISRFSPPRSSGRKRHRNQQSPSSVDLH